MVADAAEAKGGTRGQRRAVLYIDCREGLSHHERCNHLDLAQRLAILQGLPFDGTRDTPPLEAGSFLVPGDTLAGGNVPAVRGEGDLYGGVVPKPFVATKAITHRLLSPDAVAPAGWSHTFGERVRDVVLAGYTVFDPQDARLACERLLQRGPVRLKPVQAAGGQGQVTVECRADIEPALDDIGEGRIAGAGLTVEENLASVVTFSVGETRIDDRVIAYCGTQALTRDNLGFSVYGGSDLIVIRGRLAELQARLPSPMRDAVALARTYDEAASTCFPGFVASRRNYDVARGLDARGRMRQGVLEQSWRIGGASGAEVAALEAFQADESLRVVRTRCVEIYGDARALPSHAILSFCGIDPQVGPITKYALIEPHGSEHQDY